MKSIPVKEISCLKGLGVIAGHGGGTKKDVLKMAKTAAGCIKEANQARQKLAGIFHK